MNITTHTFNQSTIAELTSETILINNIEEGTDLAGNLCYQGFEKIILHQQNITPDFFDLKTGIAGELLQKFTNFRMRLAIVGNFSNYTSSSLKAFITESNRLRQTSFVATTEEALKALSI